MNLKTLLTCLLALTLTVLAACEREGPAERAGEKVDKAVEQTGDQMEKAGEQVEQKTDK